MKYTLDLTINKNRSSVWRAFDNPKNMKRWQPTLRTFEPQTGTPGQVGAVSKLTYQEDGRTLTMFETITRREEPNEFGGTYSTQGVVNELHNRFVEVNAQQTRWTLDAEFKFTGFFAIAAPLMKRSMIKRTLADMARFKAMVESNNL